MPEDQDQVHNPHDTGYRHLLTSKQAFVQLVKSFVRHGWAEQVDEASLELIDRTFVLQDFQNKEADVVYKAKLKDREVIFYVLLELQSTVDFLMPQRLLQYMNEIWRFILKNTPKNEADRKDFRLPAIVPMVLYNGKAPWTVPLNFKETLESHEAFGDLVVNFRYSLIPVRSYSEEELLETANLIALVFRLDSVDSVEEILEAFFKFSTVITKLTPDEFTLFKAWAQKVLPKSFPEERKKEIIDALEETRPGEVEKLISNVERAVKKSLEDAQREGMEKGIEKGIEKGMEKGIQAVARQMLAEGEDVEKIIRYTGLAREEIEKLKE